MFFSQPNHPLVDHIRNLIATCGIDGDGTIIGTSYTFRIDSDGEKYSTLRKGYQDILYPASDSIGEETYPGSTQLMKRASFLMKQAQEKARQDSINAMIQEDIEKYLSKESSLPEAIEAMKQIQFHKDEIVRISKEWQQKFITIFSKDENK